MAHPLDTNMPPVGILALPPGLLENIVEDVAIPTKHDIFNLRCVNKAFCLLATRVAFWEIVVHTTDKSTQNFLELLVRPDITEHVRDVKIIEDPVPYNVETEKGEDERYKRVGNRLRTACFMLHLIPVLESLVFTFLSNKDLLMDPFTYDDDLSRYQLLQLDVLEGLGYNPNPLPELKSLHINSWFAFRHVLYSAAPFGQIVKSLQDLCFVVQGTALKGEGDHEPAVDFWKDVIEPRVLLPAVNLTSLVMESSVNNGWLFRLGFNSITFPSLTILSLTNFVWDDGTANPRSAISEAEEFIVRHGATLKSLELHSCTICVPHDRSTPVRSWAAVWTRFAEKLTQLVNLVVMYNRQLRYVYFQQGHGFVLDPTLPGGTEQDTHAFEALLMIVKGRKMLNPSEIEYLWWE